MKLAELGEFGLIHRMAPRFLQNTQKGVLGIGDDCAVIPQNKNESLLVTTDLLIEDVHFMRSKISARDLGYKSLAVNLSDIAAMGGTPVAAFLSIALPEDISVAWWDDFFSGIHDLSQRSATPLLGGDTTGSKDRIAVNVTVLGKANPKQIKYRSTAKIGDILCVTGVLGDSGGGLTILLNNLDDKSDKDIQHLVKAHHLPTPHLREGKWLAAQNAVHAMLDVSDGIDSDISRILEESGVGARVDLEDIPVSTALDLMAAKFGWNAKEIAATGGEDYCLLCTIDPVAFPALSFEYAACFERPLYKIGVITDGKDLKYRQKKKDIDLSSHGWNHFLNMDSQKNA